MAKKRYRYNPQTLAYEVIMAPFRIRVYRVLRKILVGFVLASIVNLVFSFFFFTPKMVNINKANNELLLKYEILKDRIAVSEEKLKIIRQRDNNVYRQLFGADTISIYGVNTPYADSRYSYLQGDQYTYLMLDVWHNLDALSRMLYLQSRSLDELELLAKDKEKMAESIPAIWPVNRKNLRGNIGAFGWRSVHPVTGASRPHNGIDLGGRTGDPIYATGDGIVVDVGYEGKGYGRFILVDHGFGYKTRYAHLSKQLVAFGQKIKRGELIGELGNTGLSSGPHLHYEVIYRNIPVNPLNYFSRDMSNEEMERIIESAKPTTYE